MSGFGAHLGEDDDVVGELLQSPAGETGRDDARVGDQQRPRDAEPGYELGQLGERAGPVHQPRRRVDAADGVDFHTHAAASGSASMPAARARPQS